jgi:hypothetical protein
VLLDLVEDGKHGAEAVEFQQSSLQANRKTVEGTEHPDRVAAAAMVPAFAFAVSWSMPTLTDPLFCPRS